MSETSVNEQSSNSDIVTQQMESGITTGVTANSSAQPSVVVESSNVSSSPDGSASLQEMEAAYERMKAELHEQKKKFFAEEMARMKELQQQHLATLRSQSSLGGAARSMASFKTPGP